MIVAVVREAQGEARVALVPETVSRLVKSGVTVTVEHDAGDSASFNDKAYEEAGAQVNADKAALLKNADLLIKVGRPSAEELRDLKAGGTVIGFLAPLGDPDYVRTLAKSNVTALSMDAIPRITRAQSMDALSSQSNIAGYKAVLLGATYLPKFFPMLTTAAGTVPPAKVLILGAGVAGLQAIATARRLGAVVSAYDTRAVVKEQVQSLGATFLEIDVGGDAEGAGGYAKELSPDKIEKQRQFMVQHIGASDVVITTALVPGRRAPLLITEEAVKAMRQGSVIVDLAAEAGGNCAVTKPGEIAVVHGVTILGLTNLPGSMPFHASQLYSRNVFTLLTHLIKENTMNFDFQDEITKGTTLAHQGKVLHEPTLATLQTGAPS